MIWKAFGSLEICSGLELSRISLLVYEDAAVSGFIFFYTCQHFLNLKLLSLQVLNKEEQDRNMCPEEKPFEDGERRLPVSHGERLSKNWTHWDLDLGSQNWEMLLYRPLGLWPLRALKTDTFLLPLSIFFFLSRLISFEGSCRPIAFSPNYPISTFWVISVHCCYSVRWLMRPARDVITLSREGAPQWRPYLVLHKKRMLKE